MCYGLVYCTYMLWLVVVVRCGMGEGGLCGAVSGPGLRCECVWELRSHPRLGAWFVPPTNPVATHFQKYTTAQKINIDEKIKTHYNNQVLIAERAQALEAVNTEKAARE